MSYPVSDDDLDFLECYLDDALDEAETGVLRGRLASEPALAAALRQLREERSQRQAFFQSIEPSPEQVHAFSGQLRQAAHRRQWWRDQRRLARYGSAVAACLAIAVLGGFFYHASDKAPLWPTAGGDPALDGSHGLAGTPARYPVEVTDDNGHVVAVQHFDNQTEADDFARDLHKMQDRRKQNTGGLLISDHHDF